MEFINKIKLIPDAINGMLLNNPCRNGEYKLLRKIIKDNMAIVDIGANVGEYSEYVLSLANNLEVHCFEPSISTFNELERRLNKNEYKGKLFLNNYGLSDSEDEKELYIYTNTGGSNSIYFNEQYVMHSKKENEVKKEKIHLSTLDMYVKKNDIKKIDFLKIDVEGHEYMVLLGAQMSLSKGIIRRLQFEYNNYWLKSDFRLITALNFLKSYHYKLYRLTPYGMIKIYKISSKLENYKHSNYYAVLSL